jgi:hypothetical protein
MQQQHLYIWMHLHAVTVTIAVANCQMLYLVQGDWCSMCTSACAHQHSTAQLCCIWLHLHAVQTTVAVTAAIAVT